MASKYVPKTAIVTSFGMFEFLHLPEDDGSDPRYPRYCFVYTNNVLLFSPNLTSHVQYVQDFPELCRTHSLTIGLGKYEFVVLET